MEYMSIADASTKWGISKRRIQVLCAQNRIEGVTHFGKSWAIPAVAQKPNDARVKTGKYLKHIFRRTGNDYPYTKVEKVPNRTRYLYK